MALLRSIVVAVVVGSWICLGQVRGLCSDMEATCTERGRDAENRLLDHPDAGYRHCEILVTILRCIEEFLCTCNVSVNAKLDETFTSTVLEYQGVCHNVTSHTMRNSTRLHCLEGKPIPMDVRDDPRLDLEVENELNKAEIEELDGRLLRECQPYVRCSQAYHNAIQRSQYTANQQQQQAALCMANRLNIVCMSDALCQCQEAENELVKKTLRTIHIVHEDTCQEQLNVPVLKCNAVASAMMSGTLLVLGAMLHLIFFML